MLRRLESLAAMAGTLDAAAELSARALEILHSARRQAIDVGCVEVDADDAVMVGLDRGRKGGAL